MIRTAAIILLLLPGLSTRCQPFPQLRFTQLTERDGLSCDKVTAITEDKDGLIWISTSNGLNRWDGYGFTRWFANPDDTTTLPANEIENIAADKRGNIWLETAGGICRFNTLSHRVSRFNNGENVPTAFRNYDNSSICFGENDDPYIVSPSGLYHFTDNGHYSMMDEGLTSFERSERRFFSYANIVRDRKGGSWAFQQDCIYRLDDKTKKVVWTVALGGGITIYDILFDSQNRCWASTWANGILRIAGDGAVSVVPGVSRTNVYRGGVEWSFNGRRYLAFGSTKPGLLLVDEQTGKSQFYLDKGPLESIGSPFVDRQNILWLPTSKGVLNVSSSGRLVDMLPLIISGNGFRDSAQLSSAYDMREEPSGYWISRRYMGGMLWYNKDWKLIRGWSRPIDSMGPAFRDDIGTTKEVYDFKQVGNEMFFSTEWGVMVMSLKTQRRSMIQYPGYGPLLRLRTIVPVSDHEWWIRSFNQGVFVFDPVRRLFMRHYPLADRCKGCGLVSANYLLRDYKGRMFITSNSGLFQYDARADSFVPVQVTGPHALGNSLIGLAQDSAGMIWIGLDDGICAYDPDGNTVVQVLTENNSVGPVNRITIDSLQNVWFSSPSGYWCWLRRRDKLIHFRFSQGLPDNDEGLFYTTASGKVYAGCLGGLLWFHNDRLMQYAVSGGVKIMDAFAGGKPVEFEGAAGGKDGNGAEGGAGERSGAGGNAGGGERGGNGGGDDRSGAGEGGGKRLVLGPDQNNLQVNFDVINYDLPENNLFFYRLTPGPGNWVQLENGRLFFNNLPPGEYELEVKGGNKVTGNFMAEDRLTFVIRPYWWQSWWFKALAALVLLLSAGVLVWLRIRRIRQEAAFREKMADTELRALRAQMNPHFIFNSLNSIENFMMKNEKWLASDYLNKFARLFRMILHSSRNELVPFAKDMEALQLYVDLELLRFNNKFEYRTQIDPSLVDGEYRVPSLLIQPYIENAIVHGIGLSKKRGLYVQLTAFLEGDCIHYIIRDNGIGRRQAEEVNQVNRPNHRSVGLSITADRINIFSHQQHSEGSVKITDLREEDGSPAGTKVEVIIKAV